MPHYGGYAQMGGRRPSTLPKLKHTRICLSQSRNGCLTCKHRRVKCDEEKPNCLRCSRSGIVCAGYLNRIAHTKQTDDDFWRCTESFSEAVLSSFLSPWLIARANGQRKCLTELGLAVVSSDLHGSLGPSGKRLGRLLAQLVCSSPSINVAATALGAIYKLQLEKYYANNTNSNLSAVASEVYIRALQSTRYDLTDDSCEAIVVAVACVLMAFVEILLRQPRNALLHLRGAYRIFGNRTDRKSILANLTSTEGPLNRPWSGDADLDVLFQALDIQKSLYALDYEPEWMGSAVLAPFAVFSDLHSSRTSLYAILQDCLRWCAKNLRLKYFPSRQSSELLIEQGRHLAAISMWLEQFNVKIMPQYERGQHHHSKILGELEHALRLRMTCISTLIYIYNVLNPMETAYDVQEPRFQQVILDGEQVLSVRSADKNPRLNVHSQPLLPLSLGPGIIQPLFYAASKCRSRTLRRRAINCLAKAGLEGPWIGKREASLSWRIAQHEEAWPNPPSSWTGLPPELQHDQSAHMNFISADDSDDFSARHICEEARLDGCTMPPEGLSQHTNSFCVVFVRCNSLEGMRTSIQDYEGPYEEMFSKDFHFESWKEILHYSV